MKKAFKKGKKITPKSYNMKEYGAEPTANALKKETKKGHKKSKKTSKRRMKKR